MIRPYSYQSSDISTLPISGASQDNTFFIIWILMYGNGKPDQVFFLFESCFLTYILDMLIYSDWIW
jgi:hypothetical protein